MIKDRREVNLSEVEDRIRRVARTNATLLGVDFDLYKRAYVLAVEFEARGRSRFAELSLPEAVDGGPDLGEVLRARVRAAEALLGFPGRARYRRFSLNPRRRV